MPRVGVAQVQLALHQVGPGRRVRVLEVGQVDLRAAVPGVDQHLGVGRAGDLDPAVVDVGRGARRPASDWSARISAVSGAKSRVGLAAIAAARSARAAQQRGAGRRERCGAGRRRSASASGVRISSNWPVRWPRTSIWSFMESNLREAEKSTDVTYRSHRFGRAFDLVRRSASMGRVPDSPDRGRARRATCSPAAASTPPRPWSCRSGRSSALLVDPAWEPDELAAIAAYLAADGRDRHRRLRHPRPLRPPALASRLRGRAPLGLAGHRGPGPARPQAAAGRTRARLPAEARPSWSDASSRSRPPVDCSTAEPVEVITHDGAPARPHRGVAAGPPGAARRRHAQRRRAAAAVLLGRAADREPS